MSTRFVLPVLLVVELAACVTQYSPDAGGSVSRRGKITTRMSRLYFLADS